MLDGETVNGGAPRKCPDCGLGVDGPKVMRTCGYYVGYTCGCGPYSRETDYVATIAEAEEILAEMLEAERTGRQPASLRERKEPERN